MQKITKLLVIFLILFAIFLRVVDFGSTPPSLYWEEVALGYDAYSILQTGRDHHGNYLPVVAFESFGDWKPSGYFYALAPSIAVFGLTDWAIRFPSLVAGVGIVVLVGLIASRLFASNKMEKNWLQILGTGIAAVSPWAIIFSRAAWEVNLAAFFALLAIYLWLLAESKSKQKQLLGYCASALCFVLAAYTYHSLRVVGPLLLSSLALYSVSEAFVKTKGKSLTSRLHKVIQQKKSIVLAGCLLVLLMLPLLRLLNSDQISSRFAQTSIFTDISIIEESNRQRELLNHSVLSRIFYHRWVLFSREIVINGLHHFHPSFLFLSGDSNPRHSSQYFGQLYHIEALFLIIGVYAAFRRKKSVFYFLIAWLIIGILPAAITQASPHALRILPVMSVFLILISLGVFTSIIWLQKLIIKVRIIQFKRVHAWLPIILIGVAYLSELAVFWRQYRFVYPIVYASEWQYGYKDMVKTVRGLQDQYPDKAVYISREYGRPAMYYWFYTQTDPKEVQARNSLENKDQGEFTSFNNIVFWDGPHQTGQDSIIAGSPTFIKSALQRLGTASNSAILDRDIIIGTDKNEVWEIVVLP